MILKPVILIILGFAHFVYTIPNTEGVRLLNMSLTRFGCQRICRYTQNHFWVTMGYSLNMLMNRGLIPHKTKYLTRTSRCVIMDCNLSNKGLLNYKKVRTFSHKNPRNGFCKFSLSGFCLKIWSFSPLKQPREKRRWY
jgi:hypothetical protein